MGQDTSWLSNHVCHGNSRQNSAFQKEKDPGADHRAKSSADLGHSHSASFEIDRRKGNIFNVYFDGTMIEGAYVNGDLGADEDTIYAGFQTGHKSYVFDMLLEGANEHPSIIVIK